MTIRKILDDAAQSLPAAIAQRFHTPEGWASRTYSALRERVEHCAAGIIELGVKPRDRVALMLENCPQWNEIYFCLAGAGVQVVPLDPKLRELEVAHILNDSETSLIFAGGKLKKLLANILPSLPNLRALVLVDGDESHEPLHGRACWDYDALLEKTKAKISAARDWFSRNIPTPGDIASIIYTSGTTGKPKGAMLTHGNFCSDVEGTMQALKFYQTDNFFNVLPLFHSYSFTANFMLPARLGACMSFVRSLKTISEDVKILKPTIFLGVPLMIEKLYAKAAAGVNSNPIARFLVSLGIKGPIRKKIINSLGGNIRFIGVGGAPCPVDVIKGFDRFGIQILEGYGLTEASPGLAYTQPDPAVYKAGTVGAILPNAEAKLHNPDASGVGELWVRGPMVMKGYYKNPEATAEVITPDGWLKTGDLASMDELKRITIRGRCKALIVNREGKNIYPEEIENTISTSPFVQDVIVLGYSTKDETGERVGVIVTPNLDAIQAAASAPTAHLHAALAKLATIKGNLKEKVIQKKNEILSGKKSEPPASAPSASSTVSTQSTSSTLTTEAIDDLLRSEVLRLTSTLADYKHPRKIEVRHETLERTSTMKVRRVTYQGTLDEE